ncbi:MAG: ABC transporter permease [Phycisphaerales bacterium]|jgi:ABC-type Na+ efflux pump permease subunit|nr:ABC transporter permease [Phycisphaerales bacterium]
MGANKILRIARREYVSTAMTKGFIIGAFIVPLIIMAIIPVIIWLTMRAKGPAVEGEVAIIDRSGVVASAIAENLTPESIARRQAEDVLRAQEKISEEFAVPAQSTDQKALVETTTNLALGSAPNLRVVTLDSADDPEAEKAPILEAAKRRVADGDQTTRVALIVVSPDAVHRDDAAPGNPFGGYELFVRTKLDDRVIDAIRYAASEAIREARYASSGLNRAELDALWKVEQHTREVTEQGERASSEAVTQMLPLGFMILMMISVMVGGQYLLTTTIEEKSSRVIEVLLSAVSPMQLMAGKIFGQMCVGLTLLVVYSGLGIFGLISAARADLVEPRAVVLLLIFFLLAYLMIASLLAAVGSAVNELREAQSLQTPVMMLIMLPYMLWLPISRDPNSGLALVLSFVPPAGPFVMMMRVASTDPPPALQILLCIAVNAIGAYACLWAAAKIFRVGLLMHGKAPNYKTLLTWIRMA